MSVDAQRRRALEKGNAIRRSRAELKRRIKDGEQRVRPLIIKGDATENDRETADAILVVQLLRAIPGVGPETAEEICREAGPDVIGRPLGSLTDDERRNVWQACHDRGVEHNPTKGS